MVKETIKIVDRNDDCVTYKCFRQNMLSTTVFATVLKADLGTCRTLARLQLWRYYILESLIVSYRGTNKQSDVIVRIKRNVNMVTWYLKLHLYCTYVL